MVVLTSRTKKSDLTQKSSNQIVAVSVLTDAIRYQLSQKFSKVFVEGEISGISSPSSGHHYLTLKDEFAQISAVIWRTDAENIKFKLENGQKVICGGYIDVYPARGSYQLIIRQIKPVGIGEFELAFRQLHAKLKSEGLFDPDTKKPLPKYPRRVAVVTSPTGAAVRDFLQVLSRRWNDIEVVIVPTKVQGPGSADEIANAIRSISKLAVAPDVVVVTRGGGSKEDLWSFSEEVVCRAIFDCQIPVIAGVGHEVDVSLSDLVADVRALTPSEAAERLVPDKTELAVQLGNVGKRMATALIGKLNQAQSEVNFLSQRSAFSKPFELVERRQEMLDQLQARMHRSMNVQVESADAQIRNFASRLESINPLAVLARGYSLTSAVDSEKKTTTGNLLTDVSDVGVGDLVKTKLSTGSMICRVEETLKND